MTYQLPAKLSGGSEGAPYWGFVHPSIGAEGHAAWFANCWVYVIASGRDEKPVKIGISQDVPARIKAFEAGNPYGLRAVSTHLAPRGMARQVERRLHRLFADVALGREWFELSAHDAAKPIPDLCNKARMACEAYRDDILAEPELDALMTEKAEEITRFKRRLYQATAERAYERAQQIAARRRRA
jgi:hypothetical protein